MTLKPSIVRALAAASAAAPLAAGAALAATSRAITRQTEANEMAAMEQACREARAYRSTAAHAERVPVGA